MDSELEEELANEFPDLFELYDVSPDDIDGPLPQITTVGIQCGDGWFSLIRSLCEFITQQGVDVYLVQIKEKFGGLRFYYHVSEGAEVDEARMQMVNGAASFARVMSRSICEECGRPGDERRDTGWIKTRCDDCYDA